MGSSTVIMCSSRSLLILSSMAARVVDLPEPVGPVTSTNPRGLSQSPFITRGKPSASKPLISRSEEHTSELQSHLNIVCRLLLEKKKDPHLIDTRTTLAGIAPFNYVKPVRTL